MPLARMAAGDDVRQQGRELWRSLGIPVLAILLFLAAWGWLAPKVQTSLGALPGPMQVWAQAQNLWADHVAERAKESAFVERQHQRNAGIRRRTPRPKCGRGPIPASRPSSTRSSPACTRFSLALRRRPWSRYRSACCAVCRTVSTGAQPADSDLQAGLSAGLAADRHDGRVGRSTQTGDRSGCRNRSSSPPSR